MKVVFIAYSSQNFRLRARISRFVISKGYAPINGFMNFDYFMMDSIDADTQRELYLALVGKSDELWVFGEISDRVAEEIYHAQKNGVPVKYFSLSVLEVRK